MRFLFLSAGADGSRLTTLQSKPELIQTLKASTLHDAAPHRRARRENKLEDPSRRREDAIDDEIDR